MLKNEEKNSLLQNQKLGVLANVIYVFCSSIVFKYVNCTIIKINSGLIDI